MRKLDNWLTGYKNYTALVQESPDIFQIWGGLMVISGALRRRVWLMHPPYKLLSNLYVILVSPPGVSRKGGSMGLALEFLRELQGVNISAENLTLQALIKDLSNCSDTFLYQEKQLTHSSLMVVSKELSVFLGIKNLPLLAVLCDLFDYNEKWVYKTIGRGTDGVKAPWLSLYGATTPDWLLSSLPIDAIGGGFTSRVIFVVSESRNKPIPRGERPKKSFKIAEDLLYDLEYINNLSGEFKWSNDGGSFYDDWYINYKPPRHEWWISGYYERKPTHVVKIAMLFSVAENNSLIIEMRHLEQALQLLELTEYEMPKAFGGMGRSEKSQDIFKLLEAIAKYKSLTEGDLMATFRAHLTRTEMNELLNTLMLAGNIKRDIQSGKTIYSFIKW